ncbi:MAG: 5-formyltetrahydrofolate cyclo-ligase [Prevotella sp.]|jgi:5-formyltetrahydrofolate cyclo-ligase|nr:5-formyltetrahydrofolate cyclo-ligase [Prevotella sp.]
MRKDELRQQMRQIKRQFTQQQLEELSLPIVARLKDRIKDAQIIVAYYPLPDEVDIRPLLDELVAAGKTVFLPKVTDDTTMELRRYTGQQDLCEGAFGIMEPVEENHGDCPCDSSVAKIMGTVPVILVPGVAFDAAGHRLGRGRGYYDRFLNTVGTVLLCQDSLTQKNRPSVFGVCFDFQKVPEVPTDEHDVPVDEVI